MERYLSQEPTTEQQRLADYIADATIKQIDFLDHAAQRLIELSSLLLTILIGIIAFGDKFPPTYLQGNLLNKICIVIVLIGLLLAIAMGMVTIYPRQYPSYHDIRNGSTVVSKAYETVMTIVQQKSTLLKITGGFFYIGVISLAVLIASIILYS